MIKPEHIIYWIDLVVEPEEFTEIEKTLLKRYFIREIIPWLPLRAIGEMTGHANYSTVIYSINKVKTDRKFQYVIPMVRDFLWDVADTLN